MAIQQLFYGGVEADTAYPIELYDEVVVLAGQLRLPAMVKKVLPKSGKVVVTFEGTDPVLDLIMLRKTATVPASALDLVGRGM
jgi:hypothetical protein